MCVCLCARPRACVCMCFSLRKSELVAWPFGDGYTISFLGTMGRQPMYCSLTQIFSGQNTVLCELTIDKHSKCVESIKLPQQYSTLCRPVFDITILFLKIELSSNEAMHSKGAQFTNASYKYWREHTKTVRPFSCIPTSPSTERSAHS